MRRIISLVMIVFFLAGCATIEEKKRANSLKNTTRHYENTIRWAEFGQASHFINHEEVEDPGPDPAILKRTKVTAYDVLNTLIKEDSSEAYIQVEIRYYNEDTMSENTLTDRQTWKYDPEAGQWYLASPLPAFR